MPPVVALGVGAVGCPNGGGGGGKGRGAGGDDAVLPSRGDSGGSGHW